MFGYSLPLLFGRLFGIPLFVLGVIFLIRYRRSDQPKLILRQSLKSPWVWFALVLTWIIFGFELVYVANRAAEG